MVFELGGNANQLYLFLLISWLHCSGTAPTCGCDQWSVAPSVAQSCYESSWERGRRWGDRGGNGNGWLI